jgi:hypothetical protein
MRKQFSILSFALLLSSGTTVFAQRDKLDIALGAAQHKEDVQGDLQSAIADRTRPISLTWQAARARTHPRMFLTNLFFLPPHTPPTTLRTSSLCKVWLIANPRSAPLRPNNRVHNST